MIDCHKKSTLINSNVQNYKPCFLKSSVAQRCPALSAPLRPRDEQSLLCQGGFQEGRASSGAALPLCGCPRAAGDAHGYHPRALPAAGHWGGLWKEFVSLHFVWGKNGLWDALFLCLFFSTAACSERQKRWISCNDFSNLSNTQLLQMQVS